jgi:hypothetical protein
MGGTTSKPQVAEAPKFTPDLAKATFSGDYVQSELAKASETTKQLAEQAAAQAGELGSKITGLSSWVWGLTGLSGLLFLAGLGLLVYYLLAVYRVFGINNFFGLEVAPPAVFNVPDLAIHSAQVPDPSGTTDISPELQNLVVNGSLNTTLIAPTVSSLSSSASGAVEITYQYTGCPVQKIYPNVGDTLTIAYDPTKCTNGTQSPEKSTAPVTAPNWFSSFFSGQGSSGNLLPTSLDATTSKVVKATTAPLSSGGSGAYGMQWWMFINDWNYGYGKDKQVLTRPDPSNSQILNPSVSLHPTDNSLRISISIFPDSSDNSSKITPAPAGHSGSTDDVFICEVPNIPLQDWFAVSMTVFDRNLDIYIDGKLVKSCFLPGVPKPASGDITLAGNGGFSGSMCGFTHYSRMLTPGDAVNFSGAGTSCKSTTGPTTASKATGYSIKFGMYDTVGKKIQEYTF